MLVKKQGVDIVGAIDIGDKIGKSMYDVVPGIERGDREDVIVGTPEDVIKTGFGRYRCRLHKLLH